MNTQKVLAAAAILAAAGTTFAQVSPGAFTPDAVENFEGTPGARTFLNFIFGGAVGVIPSPTSFASIDAGDWIDFRGGQPVAPSSGSKFGAIFGFGGVEFDFTGIGGISGFQCSATAAGVGVDSIEFFDMGGSSIGFFSDADGWGPGDGSMQDLSWTSTVVIGSVRVDGPETCFDDIGYTQGAVPPQIVLFTSSNDDHEVTAADNLGLNYDLIDNDFAALNTAIASGDYRFAIIHNPSSNFAAGFDAALDTFVSNGNRVHMSFWNLDASPALQGTLGVDSAVDFTTPRPVFNNASHPSWGGAASPVTVDGSDPWADNGDSLTGDEIVSTFNSTGGPGATVVSNENRTLTNGFEYDTLSAPGIVNLLEAQIAWVRNSAPPPPPPGSQIIYFSGQESFDYLAAGMSQAGVTADLVLDGDFPGLTAALNNPDYGVALISNPCCFFDAGTPGALADFVDRGNVVHLSFWNMDAEPVLRTAMGVASATDMFAPRPVFNHAGHPSWGAAASPVPAGPDTLWNDNGDLVTAAAGAAIVGRFDSTTGQGAIVVANDDRTLLNSFDYDSMTGGPVTDLIAAQLGWLPSPGGDCYADFDGDGSLTIFDFLAFQNAFDGGDPAADCDEDGILTLFDFLCFQNAFDAGCE